jgi:hypothetical protein
MSSSTSSTLLSPLVHARTPEIVDEYVVLLGFVEPLDASVNKMLGVMNGG